MLAGYPCVALARNLLPLPVGFGVVALAAVLLLVLVCGAAGIVTGVSARRLVRRGLATNGGAALGGVVCGTATLLLVAAGLALVLILVYLNTST